MTAIPVSVPVRVRRRRRRIVAFGLAVAILLLAIAASLWFGARLVPPAEVLRALVHPDPGDPAHVVVWELRIPRTVIGLVAGAALGMSGALMQAVTRNPIADPGLLGVNAGASLAVVAAGSLLGIAAPGALVWFAVAGAAGAAAIVSGIGALARGGSTPVTLALAGAALTAVLVSLINLVILGDMEALDRFRFWSVGSLVARGLDMVVAVLPLVAVGAVAALLLARPLEALALGDDAAAALGQRVGLVRLAAIGAAVALAAGATAIAGPLVFVGLAVPHVARALLGAGARGVVPLSALLGAALLLVADVIGRFLALPGELEAGLVVAFLGAPVLIVVVRRGFGARR